MPQFLFQDIIPEVRLHRDALLSEYTTMRTGGPADYLIEPASSEEIIAVYQRALENDLPVFIMGNGSNLLFSDEGFPGVILRLGKAFSSISIEHDLISCQAGAMLSAVSRVAADHAFTGLEFASGIPGSVGGAIYMNAGAYGGEISQTLQQAELLIDGRIEIWNKDQMQFSYRHSAMMEQDGIVLSAQFFLSPGSKEAIVETMRDLNERRRAKQPLQYPSCGSFFKRPAGFFAGALIEQSGLKGYSVGGAQVSQQHAGFIINKGGATSKDVFDLMRHVQKTVFEKTGVTLEPEVKLIGSFPK